MNTKERNDYLNKYWGEHSCQSGQAALYAPPPDPATERHQELMQRLAEIQGLLVDILRTMQGVGPKPL